MGTKLSRFILHAFNNRSLKSLRLRCYFLLAVSLTLFACGGDGGGGSDNSSNSSNVQITITLKTNYSPYSPTEVRVFHNFDLSWKSDGYPMTQTASDTWTYTYQVSPRNDYVFNIQSRFEVSLQPYETTWVIRSSGIDAASIEVNGQALNNSFVRKIPPGNYVNVSMAVAQNGTVSPGNGVPFDIDTRIPPEVPWPRGYFDHPVPPTGYVAGLAWMQALYDNRQTGPAEVRVDWMKFYCRVNGVDTLLASDDFDSNYGGGLYVRHPFFISNQQQGTLPASISPLGLLVLPLHEAPNLVWHWWNTKWPRATIPPNTDRCWMEARVLVTGPALVQAGIDYYETGTSIVENGSKPVEAGVSEWIFSSGEWQTITVGRP